MATIDDQSPSDGGLTAQQLASFHRDGYLIVPDALPPSAVSAMLAETHALLDNLSLDNHPMTRFSTGGDDDTDHVGDDYFLESGDKIRFFFEEDAFDAQGRLIKPKARAVNKIGHYLHALSKPFADPLAAAPREASMADESNMDGENQDGSDRRADLVTPTFIPNQLARPAAVARALGFRDPRCLQSMIICKQPEIGGAVPPHQDSSFLYTNPPSAVGFWYALEDAALENGCLSFLPGSHRWAPVSKRLVRRQDAAGGTEMVDNVDGPKFPAGEGPGGGEEGSQGNSAGEYVPGEVKAGSLVLIHGNLLHKSERNTSNKGRIIYTFHVIEGAEGYAYDERNWLQPPSEDFTRVYQ